ncbi:MAG: hypothetical protein LBL57_02000 [Tannerella sp.]|jgi:hypothetical protein|nr:hypothetical protein [Tannerella sp.]
MHIQVLPRKDVDFDRVSSLVVKCATDHAAAWGIPEPEITKLTASHTAWHATYRQVLDPVTRTRGITAAKNTARTTHEDILRKFLKRWVMPNDAVTDQDRSDMGLPIYKKTRSRVPPPDDVPNPEGRATVLDGRVSLSWRGMASGSKANPYRQSVIIRYIVLPQDAPAPAHIGQLEHSLLNGRQPCELSHPEEDWGKVVYFAAAYQNARGETGAWSAIRSVIIPGKKPVG